MSEGQSPSPGEQPRSLGRSTLAVLAGFLATALISLATDQLFHVLKVYPPWGQAMDDPGQNILALSYRILYGIGGGYLAALLAPRNPMHHAIALGVVGLLPCIGGVAAATMVHLGPLWYPIALLVTAFPSAWLGGTFYMRLSRARNPENGDRNSAA